MSLLIVRSIYLKEAPVSVLDDAVENKLNHLTWCLRLEFEPEEVLILLFSQTLIRKFSL